MNSDNKVLSKYANNKKMLALAREIPMLIRINGLFLSGSYIDEKCVQYCELISEDFMKNYFPNDAKDDTNGEDKYLTKNKDIRAQKAVYDYTKKIYLRLRLLADEKELLVDSKAKDTEV